MSKIYSFSLLLLFALVSCKSGQQSKSELLPIISYEKTKCYGTCPSYVFKAFPDGKVTYTGRDFVELKGEHTASLSQEELANLRDLFDKADFFEFGNVYSANVTDLPTTYLYYDNGQQYAKVMDYYGAPEELKKLEAEIEKFIDLIEWKEI